MLRDIVKSRGNGIRVSRSTFRRQERIDIREYFERRHGDPDTRTLTRKGVNIHVARLPELLAALREAEAEALEDGLLEIEDYEEAGLEPPRELLEADAA